MFKPVAWFSVLFLAYVAVGSSTASSQTVSKKKVQNASDLPHFSYSVNSPASELVQADAATFNAFASKVKKDLDATFRDYEIEDKATLCNMLDAKLNLQRLAGEYEPALETISSIRALEEKPSAKLTYHLSTEAWLRAAIETGSTNGVPFKQVFAKHYAAELAALPWNSIQDNIREELRNSQTNTKAGALGYLRTDFDPQTRTSGALDDQRAWDLIGFRDFFQFVDGVKAEWRQVLKDYVHAHNNTKADIWQAREVSLKEDQKLTPVLAAVWDSGIDEAIFGGRAFTDPNPTPSGLHGLAFDDQGDISSSWLYPLTSTQERAYSPFLADLKGYFDIEDVIDSAEAQGLQQKFDNYSADQLQEWYANLKLFLFYLHGTHVAGIIARGNPAVRLVVARFNDQLPDFPFTPTPEWARKMAADFMQISDYFRSRNVRVVNMSWSDDPEEFETWLSKTGGGADPVERKRRAAELYKIWHGGVESAIKGAPNTLFVCAAGNADSDASFLQDVPAGLRLPNLITVGAVNQAGEETSFTSYGPTVVVDADGYEVESYVPGGTKLKLSGTSMASPNVANLGAKLVALDPSLTPAQVIDLIRRGATATDDGRRHLINPTRSVDLLQASKHSSY